MKASIDKFWEKYPALFYGITFYSGFLFALSSSWALVPLSFLLLYQKKVFQTSILFLLPSCLIYQMYTFPPKSSRVEGLFYIDSCKKTERFGEGYNYGGVLKTKEGKIACCTFSKTHYPPNAVYHVEGTVKPLRTKEFYTLKTTGSWHVVKKRISLVALRGSAKEYAKKYIEQHIAQKRAASFLQGMSMGQMDDKMLQLEFNRLGLSHLMAISGLHFSLIALALHLVLRLFLPHKVESVCLMVLLTLYLLFIGDTPSIVRTWITVMVFLLGNLFEKRTSALNSLGVALLLSLLWNPLSATSLSFQLSFLATAGILFFHAPLERFFSLLIPKYDLKIAASKSLLWQHSYIACSFFRSSLTLTCAVHVTIVALILQTFHTISLNSLVYNLFFPFLASLALLFFMASIPLGHWAHVLNGYYCDWILRIPESPPLLFKGLYVEQIPAWLSSLLLTALLIAAVSIKIKESRDRLAVRDLPLFDHL